MRGSLGSLVGSLVGSGGLWCVGALTALVFVGAASGDSVGWFDGKRGCGQVGAFARTGHAADLPGCSGKLSKDAPRAELALHDIKLKMIAAEQALDKNALEKVDAALVEVEAALAKAQPPHPDLPDRWEQAQTIYGQLVHTLKGRRRLVKYADDIRARYAAAIEADKTRNRLDIDGGPAEARKLASACAGMLAEVKVAGVDMSTPFAIDPKGPLRQLTTLDEECRKVVMRADGLMRGQAKAKADKLRASKRKRKQ